MMKTLAHFLLTTLVLSISASETTRAQTHHVLRFNSESGYPRAIRTMQLSPDGSRLAVSTKFDKLSIIRTKDGQTEREFDNPPFAVAFSRDGSRMHTIGERKSLLFDFRLGQEIDLHSRAGIRTGDLGVSFHIQGGRILVDHIAKGGPVDANGKIQKGDEIIGIGEGRGGDLTRVIGFTLQRFQPLLQGEAGSYVRLRVAHQGRFEKVVYTLRRQAVAFQNGRRVYQAYQPPKLDGPLVRCLTHDLKRHEFRQAATGKVVSRFGTIDVKDVGQPAISPDGKLFAVIANNRSGEGYGIEVFSIASQERLAYVPFPGETWLQIRFSPDSSKLLIGTRQSVEVLDVKTRQYGKPYTLGWNPPKADLKKDTTGATGAVVRSTADAVGFNLARARQRSPQQLLYQFAVSSQGVLAVGDPFGLVTIWDMVTGTSLKKFPTEHGEYIEAIEFSSNGKWLAFYIQGELHILDASDLKSQGPIPANAKNEPPAALLTKSKVFQASNGAEIQIRFDKPVTEEEYQKAVQEFLKSMSEKDSSPE